jgi:alkylhydroperoxidase family enzyme
MMRRNQIAGAVVALTTISLLGCGAQTGAQDTFEPPARLSAPRLAPFDESELTREQLIAMGTDPDNPDVRPRMNLFRTMMHNVELMDHWRPFGDYVNASDSISARDKELLIMRLAWLYYSEYEWGAHYNVALGAGLTEEQIEQTKAGPDSPIWDDFDRAWLRAADELYEHAFITDANWEVLRTRYSESQLMHMFATVAHYHLVAMMTNTLGIERDAFLGQGFDD